MRIAIVHDWLTVYAGAERVLEKMLSMFPSADLFSLVNFLPEDQRHFLGGKAVQTSFIQRLPFARGKYRHYLPLMPLAIEQFDLSGYDLVLSSSHAVAKGVLTGPGQLHICMCYSPMRYVWDLKHQYLQGLGATHGLKSWLMRFWLHKIRIWDATTANGVDQFIAISKFIQKRIKKSYGRDSVVIYPPVDVGDFKLVQKKEDFFLTASRMVPYKRIDLIVKAFTNLPDKKLIVIGDGPEINKIKSLAGSNVSLLGYQDRSTLIDYMQRARAFVFAAEEDFGIAPIEAQACGTPVIAYGKGGCRETICDLDNSEFPTGVFFEEQSVSSLQSAIERFDKECDRLKPEECRNNAMRFSPSRFCAELRQFVDDCLMAR